MHTFATSHRHTYVYIYFLSMPLIKGRQLWKVRETFYYRDTGLVQEEFKRMTKQMMAKSTHWFTHDKRINEKNNANQRTYDGHKLPGGVATDPGV